MDFTARTVSLKGSQEQLQLFRPAEEPGHNFITFIT